MTTPDDQPQFRVAALQQRDLPAVLWVAQDYPWDGLRLGTRMEFVHATANTLSVRVGEVTDRRPIAWTVPRDFIGRLQFTTKPPRLADPAYTAEAKRRLSRLG